MKSQYLNIHLVSACFCVFSLTGCIVTPNPSARNLPVQQHINDGRFDRDRTLVLSDISPVVPAFVEHPFDVCDIGMMKLNSPKGLIEADLNTLRDKRVYRVGEIKCIIPQS